MEIASLPNINNKHTKKEISGTSPFVVALKECLGVKLNKEVKDSYNENPKMLKKISEDGPLLTLMDTINNGKMAILCKTSYRFNAIPTKMPV